MSTKVCSEIDCSKKVFQRGVCRSHYDKARKAGILDQYPDHRVLSVSDYIEKAKGRLLNRIKVLDNGCWEWSGSFSVTSKYSLFRLGKKQTTASRASYILFNGPLSDEQQACHSCDYPPCVNPEHLFSGTALDNAQDKMVKGRTNKGEDRPLAKLTEVIVREIRASDETVRALAAKYDVSHSLICAVRTGKIWRHVK